MGGPGSQGGFPLLLYGGDDSKVHVWAAYNGTNQNLQTSHNPNKVITASEDKVTATGEDKVTATSEDKVTVTSEDNVTTTNEDKVTTPSEVTTPIDFPAEAADSVATALPEYQEVALLPGHQDWVTTVDHIVLGQLGFTGFTGSPL